MAHRRRFVAVVVLLTIVLVAFVATALAAQGGPASPTDLEAIFRNRQGIWVANAQRVLTGLFGALLVLEIAVSSLEWHRRRLGVDAIVLALGWKVGAVAAMLFLFRFPHLTTEPVIAAFERLGGMVAGETGLALTPSEVVRQGGEVAQRLFDQLRHEQGMPLAPPEEQGLLSRFSAWMGGIYNAFGIGLVNALFAMGVSALVILLVALVIVAAYCVVALQLLLVKVESVVVLSTGIVFLPFASFRLTAGLAEGYLKYALEVGVRFFFLQVIAGVGWDLFASLYDVAGGLLRYDPAYGPMHWVLNAPFLDWQAVLTLVFAAVGYAYLAWKIPGLYARRFVGEVRLGIADGLRGG